MLKLFDWLQSLFQWVPFVRPVKATKRVKRKRAKIKRDWHLMDLLNSLDQNHARFKLRYCNYSWISRGDWRGLRAVGAHVLPPESRYFPNPERSDVYSIPSQWSDRKLPNCMHIGWRDLVVQDDSDVTPCRAIWAIRQPKGDRSLWRVEKTPGELYTTGFVYDIDGQEFSLAGYVSLDFQSREIYVPKLLMDKSVRLPRGGIYCRKEWAVPREMGEQAYKAHQDKYDSQEDAASRMLAACFCALYEAWHCRDEYYQVSTRKNKSRITFCISGGEQKFFFKDRDKTAIASDGKRKRIVHFVREHRRSNGQMVKEHLRGIRRFIWHGYEISIIIPQFHLTAYGFDVPAVDEEDMVIGQKYLDLNCTLDRLAKEEDEREYRHGRLH